MTESYIVAVSNVLAFLVFVGSCKFTLAGEPTPKCLADAANINSNTPDEEFIKFMPCVVDSYAFKASTDKTMWLKQLPNFKEDLGKESFNTIAESIEKFFMKKSDKRIRNWEQTKEDISNIGNTCQNMLFIVAARQLYVTYVLKKVCNDITLCEEDDKDKKTITIPPSACYPTNPGSARCTSDYDVGLIGPTSGSVVKKYSEYFKNKFGMSSDALFDNNVYAYDLEMAMSELFVLKGNGDEAAKKHKEFLVDLEKRAKEDVKYQMLDLALAYFKVFMYGKEEESKLKDQADKFLADDGQYKGALMYWYENLETRRKEFESDAEKGDKELDSMSQYRAGMYSWLVDFIKEPSRIPETASFFSAIARTYASEAYLTRGAIRVVVGSQQMKSNFIENRLTLLDHWVSAIENYGDILKVYKRECKERDLKVRVCLLKLSKYMWRTFVSIQTLLGASDINLKTGSDNDEEAIKRFLDARGKPVKITDNWVKCFKDAGKTEIAEQYSGKNCQDSQLEEDTKNWVGEFLEKILGCDETIAKVIESNCIKDNISSLLRGVNMRMLLLANKKHLTATIPSTKERYGQLS